MTPDERNILQAFLTDLTRAPAVAKDPEAMAMIQGAIGADPNALYLLVQHAILADQALHAAQAQLQAQPAPSFLPAGGVGPWAGQGGAPVASSPMSANSGLGSFLRSAGTMAAGVAAGDFLFQGMENLFSPRW